MTDALPCPFCGAAPKTGIGLLNRIVHVVCINAACNVRPGVLLADGSVSAVEVWNTRATPPAPATKHPAVAVLRELVPLIDHLVKQLIGLRLGPKWCASMDAARALLAETGGGPATPAPSAPPAPPTPAPTDPATSSALKRYATESESEFCARDSFRRQFSEAATPAPSAPPAPPTPAPTDPAPPRGDQATPPSPPELASILAVLSDPKVRELVGLPPLAASPTPPHR